MQYWCSMALISVESSACSTGVAWLSSMESIVHAVLVQHGSHRWSLVHAVLV